MLDLNPFDWPGDDPLLLIFDGIDELVREGKDTEELVKSFLDHVLMELRIAKERQFRLKVIISGREYAIQGLLDGFWHESRVFHLLPYHVDKELTAEFRTDDDSLFSIDQRDEWWQIYGSCKGLGYECCPAELKTSIFSDLIKQPLLNHLVARVYENGDVDFTKEINPNLIFAQTVSSVYHREDWAEVAYRVLSHVTEEDFNRFLEEISVCVWHGGRTTTVGAIQERCRAPQLQRVLETLAHSSRRPINLLLSAFFFRQGTDTARGDRSVEFTHKTFYEYLTARKVIRELGNISRDLDRKRVDPDDGCDASQALIRWARLCGPMAMDVGLFAFLANEMKLLPVEEVRKRQKDLKNLINTC